MWNECNNNKIFKIIMDTVNPKVNHNMDKKNSNELSYFNNIFIF